MLGKTVGSYEVTEKLGEGGMGAVYLARHTLLGRKAAIKVLLPEFSRNPSIVTRFFNEAKAATAIEHPGIINVFDFGYDDAGQAFLAMDFLDGDSLSKRLKNCGKLSIEQAILVGCQISGALAAAHGSGIVHRDLKPDNIMLIADPDVRGGERIKILDFGIAKLTDSDVDPVLKTRTGSVMGTPVYMAPEQCRGLSNIDHRADIYSLGCVLYELVCGHPPFSGEGTGDLIAAHIAHVPTPPRARGARIPEGMETVILRMLAKKPEDRYQTMEAVVQALEAIDPEDIELSAFETGPTLSGSPDDNVAPAVAALGTTMSGTSGESTGHVSALFDASARSRTLLWILGAGAGTLVLVGAFVLSSSGRESKAVDDNLPQPAAASAPIPEIIDTDLAIISDASVDGGKLREQLRTDGSMRKPSRETTSAADRPSTDSEKSGNKPRSGNPVLRKPAPRKPIKDGTLDPFPQ